MHVAELTSACVQTLDALFKHNEPALLVGPTHYGKRKILDRVERECAGRSGFSCFRLSSATPDLASHPDYSVLWSNTWPGLGLKSSRRNVTDRSSYAEAVRSGLLRQSNRVVAMIDGIHAGNDDAHWELLLLFNQIYCSFRRDSDARPSPLLVLGVDDYTHYYQRESTSDLDYRKIYFSAIAAQEITDCIVKIASLGGRTLDVNLAKVLGGRVHGVSGGHPGLVAELVRMLQAREWSIEESCWANNAAEMMCRSPILESLLKILDNDPASLAETALRCGEPRPPDTKNPCVALLRRNGVLQRHTPGTVRLCPGAIKDMVQQIAARHEVAPGTSPFSVPGTAHDDSGQGKIVAGADDFVVVHLADIHVSEKHYQYRIEVDGKPLDDEAESVKDLLERDLDRLGIRRRIDALVLAGDYVWNGRDTAEFDRSEEVIEDIWHALGLGVKRTVLVPGNHDVAWDPEPLAATGDNPRASRDNYERFRTLLGKRKRKPNPRVANDFVEVRSSSGRALRIIGLDSNDVEGPDLPGIGFVSRESFAAAERWLGSRKGEGVVWVCLHHPIVPAVSHSRDKLKKGEFTLLGNASDVLKRATEWNAELILSGHEHQPTITWLDRWAHVRAQAASPIVIVGAGSFGVKTEYLGPIGRNHYYVIHRHKKSITFISRRLAEDGRSFEDHERVSVPVVSAV